MKLGWIIVAIAAYLWYQKGQQVPSSTQNAINAGSSTLGPGPQGYSSNGTGPGASISCFSNTVTNPPIPTVANFWTAQKWNSKQTELWTPKVLSPIRCQSQIVGSVQV